jgi:hypothetical protein
MPGDGFIAAEDIPQAQARVFKQDWFAHPAPTDGDFEASLGAARNNRNPVNA